jgi:peptidoglycan/LPS O-acetylase OafA/YrhL
MSAAGIALIVLGAVALAQGGLGHADRWTLLVGVTASPVAFACLLSAVLDAETGSRLSCVFAARWLRTIGAYSYCLYIVHYPLRNLVSRWVERHHSELDPARWLAVGVFTFALSFAVAWVSWRVLERPFLTLKRRFARARPTQAEAGRSEEGGASGAERVA